MRKAVVDYHSRTGRIWKREYVVQQDPAPPAYPRPYAPLDWQPLARVVERFVTRMVWVGFGAACGFLWAAHRNLNY